MRTAKHGKRSKQPAGRGGLSGKARRNRCRGRAARLYSQQLIDEYLEDEPGESRRERFIPVRGRSEFLPSAQCPGSEVREEPKRRSAIRLGSRPGGSTNAPVVRPARPPVQTPEPEVPDAFTTRGFLRGCAMGTAAAAVILLLVQVVLP